MGPKVDVVSDTGPLIHLSEIECSNLLNIFNMIYISDNVRQEYLKHRSSISIDIFSNDNIKLYEVEKIKVRKFIDQHKLSHLHQGEKDSLYLCNKLSINLILTDDLAVRNVVKKLNITPVGSLGVIIKSFREKIISFSQAEKYITNLYDISSLYVTKTIIDLVLEELRKVSKI